MTALPLPASWIATTIEQVASINGKAFSPWPFATDLPVHFVPMSAVVEEFGGIDVSSRRALGEVQKGYTAFVQDDVIFAKITPCMENGKIALVPPLPDHIAYGSTEFQVLRANGGVTPRWLAHFVAQGAFRRLAQRNMTGSAGQMRVPTAWLAAAPIPVAPLREQHRIVEKLEELLGDLDAGVTELRAAQAKLKLYRQSLLNAAVSGQLNAAIGSGDGGDIADFSEEKSLPEDWVWTDVGHLVERIETGKSFKCDEREPGAGEVGVIKVSAVSWGEFNEHESKTCVDDARINESLYVKSGDFLFSRANTIELVGACVIARDVSKQVMLSDKILRFVFVANEAKSWLLLVLRSKLGRRQIEELASGNQESMRNIGQQRIRQISVPMPPPSEIERIVGLLGLAFEKVSAQDAAIRLALRQSEAQRKNILHAAFSGQLVPQDPSDEPASVLLERIRASRAGKATAPTRRPRKAREPV